MCNEYCLQKIKDPIGRTRYEIFITKETDYFTISIQQVIWKKAYLSDSLL